MKEEKIITAVERFKRSFASGKTLPLEWRLAQLDALRRMLQENEEDLVAAVRSRLKQADIMIRISEIDFLLKEIHFVMKRLPRWLKPEKTPTPLPLKPGKSYIVREPYGVAVVISPWNYPLQLALSPAIGAICAGNCLVLKPSEMVPEVSDILAKLIPQYLDNDTTAVIQGDAETTQALLHTDVDFVQFTGSTSVGRKVMAAAAERTIPVLLELGGKCPCIVEKNADLELAACRIVWGKFLNAGQTCVAPDYVYVAAEVEDEFLDQLKVAIRSSYGEDASQSSDYARIIHAKHLDRLSSMLRDGDIVIGGQVQEKELFLAPTVMRNIQEESLLLRDEIFGPILPVLPFRNLDEVFIAMNQLPAPLTIYAFSRDKAFERRLMSQTRSGSLCMNDVIMQLTNLHLPFGGVGQSGFGRYHGRASFLAFSYQRSVLASYPAFDLPLRYPPYTMRRSKWLRILSRYL